MTDLMVDGDPPKPVSFDVKSIGRQYNSQKETMPAYSFGTSSRERSAKKVILSKAHEKRKAIMNSPGPVYGVPSTVGDGPKFGFGTEEQRTHAKAPYPDSSVDLTCSTVDSQTVKFHSTKGVHFGTEQRMNSQNAEIIRTNPTGMLGMCSPSSFDYGMSPLPKGSYDYGPKDELVNQAPPEFSFGPQNGKINDKQAARMSAPQTCTPRHVGPGSHGQPSGMGSQPNSRKKSAPSWSFGGHRHSDLTPPRPHKNVPLLDLSPELSSLGRQVVSSARSAPQCGFGSATRDQSARTYLVVTEADRGAAAALPKPRFHVEMPPPERRIPKPGM
mmetsp:Transcript_39295/g.69113  ORF Transcript_39295/g.69113 Transcript_39295/m.69113 type:complete len:329 (-) Transcript_39295:117-1103(-)